MSSTPSDIDDSSPGASSPKANPRLRFELIFASIWLAIGFFVLPAVIYAVGVLLLGPYGESAGLGSFYADFFGDLVQPAGRAWTLALGPFVLISALRLVFFDFRGEKPDDTQPESESEREPRPTPRQQARLEPRVSAD